jgi:catechol 2,3-dioxygenase-like lactoylglutathione lyase family enzyme
VAEAGTQKVAQLKMISPQFVVPDVKVAAEYYRDVFGFKILGYFLEPPVYAIYKCYEIVVEDQFGFRLTFGMDISGKT